jgi:hypothetical protein
MSNISFQKTSQGISIVECNDNDSVLLASFIEDYRYIPDLDKLIQSLEDVQGGRKVFEEIKPLSNYWAFAYGTGLFECDAKTAWLDPFPENMQYRRIEMHLDNLIFMLKEWRTFLTE